MKKIPQLSELYVKLKKELLPDKLAEFEAMEKQGAEDRPYIEALLKTVQKKMGVFDRIRVVPEVVMTLMGNDVYMGIGELNGTELLFSPGIRRVMDDDMLRGVIAHELGHHINGDPKRKSELLDGIPFPSEEELEELQRPLLPQFRKQEYDADEMAAKFGYGPGLTRALRMIRDRNLLSALLEKGDGSHPTLFDRIARLRRYDGELREAA